MAETTKTRYYRHNDPRRGFKICQQLQIASEERMIFSQDIQKINKMYRECSSKHSKCFTSQPSQNQILQKFVILLTVPLVVNFLLENFKYLVESYIISILMIVFYVNQYMNRINSCRRDFDEANDTLCQQFCELQRDFQQKWPHYSLTLMRQWNQFNQTCIQYIEIYRKQNIQEKLSCAIDEGNELCQIMQNSQHQE